MNRKNFFLQRKKKRLNREKGEGELDDSSVSPPWFYIITKGEKRGYLNPSHNSGKALAPVYCYEIPKTIPFIKK